MQALTYAWSVYARLVPCVQCMHSRIFVLTASPKTEQSNGTRVRLTAAPILTNVCDCCYNLCKRCVDLIVDPQPLVVDKSQCV